MTTRLSQNHFCQQMYAAAAGAVPVQLPASLRYQPMTMMYLPACLDHALALLYRDFFSPLLTTENMQFYQFIVVFQSTSHFSTSAKEVMFSPVSICVLAGLLKNY